MAKNIVIFCDGTNNEIAGNQTSVLRLFRMLVCNGEQRLFYDAGVGTHADPTAQWPLQRLVQKRLDAAIGMSIRNHVLGAYSFLSNHYEEGDRIYLFGFSRGAYTVRALAGMLFRCGLLCADYDNLSAYAWSVFSDEDRRGDRRQMFGGAARIKKVFGREVPIHFVGVWDTVSTFGWLWDLLTVPNTDKNPIVHHFRQALSIDEKRPCFEPILFNPQKGQSSIQVWFAGVHADIGGGYPPEASGLSRLPLEWMLNEAVQLDLIIDPVKVKKQLLEIGTASERCEFSEQHDESVRPMWRIQGWLPKHSFRTAERRYMWHWPNWATRRTIPEDSLVHQSVKTRMDNATLRYEPKLPTNYTLIRTVPCHSLSDLLLPLE